MFDPHAKYLPGTNAAQPGLKINFQRANLLGQFPDSFLPYTHFGCTLRQHFEGTLFRFPLRYNALLACDLHQRIMSGTPSRVQEIANRITPLGPAGLRQQLE